MCRVSVLQYSMFVCLLCFPHTPALIVDVLSDIRFTAAAIFIGSAQQPRTLFIG